MFERIKKKKKQRDIKIETEREGNRKKGKKGGGKEGRKGWREGGRKGGSMVEFDTRFSRRSDKGREQFFL